MVLPASDEVIGEVAAAGAAINPERRLSKDRREADAKPSQRQKYYDNGRQTTEQKRRI